MTPQEKDLILTVADRLKKAELPSKDADADRLISGEIASQPDAAYKLTQAVLIQEQALKEAQNRIGAMEKELKRVRAQASGSDQGSFLGGLFGGGAKASKSASPQSTEGAGPSGLPASARTGAASTRSFGDFMQSAASVALGVAGGHLLFSGLSNLFDGAVEAGAAQAAESGLADAAETETGGWGQEDGFDPAAHGSVADAADGAGWGQEDTLPAEDDPHLRFGDTGYDEGYGDDGFDAGGDDGSSDW
jgi:hypothetical protein